MSTTDLTLRFVVIDPVTGEAGVAEICADRYDLADTYTRNQLAAECATAALDNLTRMD